MFEIASFSKPITSTILASLVGEGKIGWDDRIVDLDPGFRLSSAETTRQIEIRDFLSHRSGLATESGDLLEDLGYSRPDILYRMRYLPLPGQFRKTYAYSNFGYTTGAIAAATKIGKPWETIAEEQLYSRLGMTSTSSRFSDYDDRANKAALHIFLDGEPVNRFVREADPEALPVASVPARVISPNGCGCNSVAASGRQADHRRQRPRRNPQGPDLSQCSRPGEANDVPAASSTGWAGSQP